MSFKQFALAALLAATTLGAPSAPNKLDVSLPKRDDASSDYVHGWCGLHFHRDASNKGATGKAITDKFEIKVYEGGDASYKKEIGSFPQTDLNGNFSDQTVTGVFTFPFTFHNSGKWMINFNVNNQKFLADAGKQNANCKSGKVESPDIGDGWRYQEDGDCGFTC
ncbi:Uu.00g047660.m01.CDS01 [Anthostomella pinea]|uniref:Uu.00g047660.m01.CDS01 n=1 Tax=Anthostomella pinea TaxID=933095 RepID=A0AAI8VBP1_9PEZI|nr:Uu.00g047660.m01.CDS01 [Anthostomella pinea]